jgi:spermidine synthase
VIESLDFGRMLVLDGVINLTERDEFIYHEMLVHVPLFSHPHPSNVLVIGGGDGGTAREVLKHQDIKKVQQVEIDEEVVGVCRSFFPDLCASLDHQKVGLLFMDAVQYMEETEDQFDIILLDSTDPVIEQSEDLFGGAFFRDCLGALTDQGILAAQVGDIHFDTPIVQRVLRNLSQVFPVVNLYLAPVPSYTLLPYAFAFCSKTVLPEACLGISRYHNKLPTRYYNPEIHKAAFALPQQLKEDFRAFS